MADYAFLSLTSFILPVLVARDAGVTTFGLFALVQAVMLAFTAGYRQIIGATVVTGELSSEEQMSAIRLFPWIAGVPAGAIVIVVTLIVFKEEAWWVACGFGLLLPGTFITLTIRYSAYRVGSPGGAAAVSAGTLLAPIVMIFVSLAGLEWYQGFAAYGACYIVSAVAMTWVITRGRSEAGWNSAVAVLRRERSSLRALSAVYAGAFVTQVGTPALLAAFAGAASLGAFRGGQTVLSLGLQVPQALHPPMLAKTADGFRRRGLYDKGPFISWLFILVLSCLVVASVALVLPNAAGHAFLGDVWGPAKSLVPLILLEALLAQTAGGLETQFRALNMAGRATVPRSVATGIGLLLVSGGALVGDAEGAVVGLASGHLLLCAWLAVRLKRVMPQ